MFFFRFNYVLVAFLVLVVVAVLIGRHALQARPNISHVVLISIDTCRPDHLGCYGYRYPTTPNLDMLALESVVFQHAYSPVPLTLPAHASMLTGLIPPHHRVHDNNDYRLEGFNQTLAEVLKNEGFATAGIAGAVVMDSVTGIDQGFDLYDDRLGQDEGTSYVLERRADEVSHLGIRWLQAHRDGRAFLFLHYYDPHETYDPPEPYRTKFGKRVYDGEIAYVDHCIGKVIEALKTLEIYDSTLLIVTSDHGEMLGEHGEATHGYFIYQSAIKIPLIVKLPGQHDGRKNADLVGLVDIFPTVLGLLGIEPALAVDGIDLTPALSGRQLPDRDTPVYCESLYATKYNANGLYGIVTDRWKYIHTTRPELYDLRSDPAEANNLADRQHEMNTALRGELEEIMDARRRDLRKTGQLPNAEIARKLASLSYVTSSSVNESFSVDPTKDDPKGLIDAHAMSCKIYGLIADNEYESARTLSEALIRQRPDFYPGHFHLGSIEMGNENYGQAIRHLSSALEQVPHSSEVRTHLGHSHNALRQWESAGEQFRRILELWPYHAGAHSDLGNVLFAQGKRDEAITHFRKAIALDPDDPESHNDLAMVLFDLGRLDEAIGHVRESLRLYSDAHQVHGNLSIILRNQGSLDEAIYHAREAVRLAPDIPGHYNSLSLALQAKGVKPDEAIDHLRTSLRLKDDDALVHYGLGKLLIRLGRAAEGIPYLREAVRLEPGNAGLRRELDRALKEHGKVDH